MKIECESARFKFNISIDIQIHSRVMICTLTWRQPFPFQGWVYTTGEEWILVDMEVVEVVNHALPHGQGLAVSDVGRTGPVQVVDYGLLP